MDGAVSIVTINGGVEIAPEELETMVNEIVQGYQAYAAANALPDPSKMGEHFSAYLRTRVSEIINVAAIQAQLSSVLGSYMESVMGSYTEAITQAIQSQVSAVMQQVIAQMSSTMQTTMQNAMQAAIEQIGANMENAFTFD